MIEARVKIYLVQMSIENDERIGYILHYSSLFIKYVFMESGWL